MTTNQEQAWRLEDAEGNLIGEEPSFYTNEELRFYDGSPSIRRTSDEMEYNGPYSTFNVHMGTPVRNYAREYLAGWGQGVTGYGRARETETDNIYDMISQEIDRYSRNFPHRPEYISLDRRAYMSLRAVTGETIGQGRRVENFMGIEVMCNPLQQRSVMVLGTGRQEGLGRGLYHEE